MTELILHQYDESPWATKIRFAMGFKGMSYRTVRPPMLVPKEDHFELTGGYRRVPVLQVGANIYCDSHRIMTKLDELQPSPPLSPPGHETEDVAFTRWSGINFDHVMAIAFGAADLKPEWIEERVATMVPPGTDLSQGLKVLGSRYLQIELNIARIDQQLADGRPYLFGDQPSGVDFSVVHPLRALVFVEEQRAPDAPGQMSEEALKEHRQMFEHYPRALAWLERVMGSPQGDRAPMESSEAIAIAAAAEPIEYQGDPVVPKGLELGQPVVVIHEVYGTGTVTGKLAASGLGDIAVRRRGERVGDVICHFPRDEFILMAAE